MSISGPYYSIEESSANLKINQRFEWLMLVQQAGLLPAIADWKIKQALGFHLWQDSIHAHDMRSRLVELRYRRADKDLPIHIDGLRTILDTAPTPKAMLRGIYEILKGKLIQRYEQQIAHVSPVQDAPTIHLMQAMVNEEKEQCVQMLALLHDSQEWPAADGSEENWLQTCDRIVEDLLESVYQNRPINEQTWQENMVELQKVGSHRAILPVDTCARPRAFQIGTSFDPPTFHHHRERVIWDFGHYVQEMQAAETICSTVYEIAGMPWEFYYDLARHIWDEVRHSTMGEVRLQEEGISLEDITHMVGNYEWRQEVDPVRRYVSLTLVIEANAFPLKNERLKHMQKANDYVSAQAILYDITDETMHVQYGKKWTPALIEHMGWNVSVEQLVEECRVINAHKTLNPTQRF